MSNPELDAVLSPVESEEDTTVVIPTIDGCTTHTNYKGLRLGKKNKECPQCVSYYEHNRRNGVAETRAKKTK